MPTTFVATTTRGAEAVLAAELAAVGCRDLREERGAVRFSGPLSDGYRACLWSRIASRILLQLDRFPVRSAEDLYRGVRRSPWAVHIDPRGTLAVDFVGSSAAIRDARFGAMKTKDAIVDRVRDDRGRRPGVDLRQPDLRINVHLRRGWATLSLDLSGEPLHRRGWGREAGPAPLKETLAAALLWLADWPAVAAAGAALVDPVCGSGTFALEAAGIALNRAPGLARRRWGFSRWLQHDERTWRRLCRSAAEAARPPDQAPPILGCDLDPGMVRLARQNATRAGLEDAVRLVRRDLEDLSPPRGAATGILVANPPFGERLSDARTAGALYGRLGDLLRRRFPGWTGWILAGSPALAKEVGLKPAVRHIVHNGPLECRWLGYPISETPVIGSGPGWRTGP